MSRADLLLMRDGLLKLYALYAGRGDRRAAEECVTCAQIITNELRTAALLAPKVAE
jgi:hypothetical protein